MSASGNARNDDVAAPGKLTFGFDAKQAVPATISNKKANSWKSQEG